MSSASGDFLELIQRVRAGDEAAAAEIVRRFEPHVRRVIRARLTDPSLLPVIGLSDLAQSVMKSFLIRAELGEYNIESPDDLCRLLMTMARNKLLNQERAHHAARRDVRRVTGDAGDMDAADQKPRPDEEAMAKDFREEVLRRLTPDERQAWEEYEREGTYVVIAKRRGCNVGHLARTLKNALRDVARSMGFSDVAGGRDE